MKKKLIVICDKDRLFADSLAAYINTKTDPGCEALSFSSEAEAENTLGKEPVEILLSDRAHMAERPGHVRYVLRLAGDEPPESTGEDGEEKTPSVYKYQSAENLMSEMMKLCSSEKPGFTLSQRSGRKTRVIAVISPIGRCGKTMFAVTLGKELSGREKVIYIPLEDYRSFDCPSQESRGGDLTDLMLFLRREKGDFGMKLESMLRSCGSLRFIPPSATPCDLRDIGSEEWIQLLNRISGNTQFETVILDMGMLPDEVFSLLLRCDRIYVPGLDDPVSRVKLNHFREVLRAQAPEAENAVVSLRLPALPAAAFSSFPDSPPHEILSRYVRNLLAWEERKETEKP